jgi:phage baseplate assembly protein W
MSTPDGPHLSFPFRIGVDGRTVQIASLTEHVRDEIFQMVLTSPGERLFLPEFGGGARRLVFEPASEATQAMAKAMLTQAFDRWLANRATIEELQVNVDASSLTVDISYRIAGTPDLRVLRFQRNG